jgi:hypothetical protein
MVVQKLCLKEELTNFTASSMVHPSFEGLPTFTDALSKDEGQAFLFLGMVKVGVIVFKEILLCAKKKFDASSDHYSKTVPPFQILPTVTLIRFKFTAVSHSDSRIAILVNVYLEIKPNTKQSQYSLKKNRATI